MHHGRPASRRGEPIRSRPIRAARLLAGSALIALTFSAASTAATAPAGFGRFPDPAPASPATIWAVGDGASGTAPEKAVSAMVAAARPSAFLYLGDVYEYGTAAEFRDNYDSVYRALRPITLPTPGNHDWANHRAGYDPYWSSVTGGTPAPYYAVTLAGWRIISLNSETDHSAGSPQVAWLRRQLRAPGTCRLAFWHRPRFSAGLHGDNPDVAPFVRALRGRATLLLGGHDHDMQQFRIRGGLTQLVAGAAGRGHYPVDETDARLAWSDDTTDGALRITLEPGRARFAFVSVGGKVLRAGARSCRPAA